MNVDGKLWRCLLDSIERSKVASARVMRAALRSARALGEKY